MCDWRNSARRGERETYNGLSILTSSELGSRKGLVIIKNNLIDVFLDYIKHIYRNFFSVEAYQKKES